MNKDNVINVISVKQMGYLLLNDEEMDMSWEKPFYESRTCRRDDTCFRQWFN